MMKTEQQKQEEAPVEKFQTSCDGCVFAQFTEGVQLENPGCDLDRLNKFINTGRAISHENGYHIIDGICNTCRGQTWADAHIGQNLIATVEREIEVGVDIVLYAIDEGADIEKRLGQAVKSCAEQKRIKPKRMIVVIKSDNAPYKSLYNILQDMTAEKEIPFQLVRVIEEGADINRCVTMGIDKCSSQYTAVFSLVQTIPVNFLTRLNTVLNYDMVRFVMIEPTHGYNCMVLQTGIFKALGKNYNIPIFEKIKEVACDQDNESLILTWDGLWNQE